MDDISNPEEPRVYSIPQENLSAFQEKIARLQKRAVKLNSGVITVTAVGHEDHPGYFVSTASCDWMSLPTRKLVYLKPGEDPFVRFGTTPFESAGFARRYHQFTIVGTSPVLNGWRFLGTLEVISDEGGKFLGNAVRCVPGETMPVQFREAPIWCDHCKTNRRWKSTFVVQHEDGRAMQVGKRCLKDFTGHNSPDAVAAMAEYLIQASELADCAEDDEWGDSGGFRSNPRFDVQNVLERTACLVRMDGWKPSSFEENSTRAALQGWLYAKSNDEIERYEACVISDYDRTTAREAMEWMQGLSEAEDESGNPTASDYLYNLSILSRSGTIDSRSLGFLASGIGAYLRHVDRLQTIAKEKVTSQYVGEIKKRQEMTLTVQNAKYFEGEYGTTTLLKFRDEQDNVVVWWASDSKELERGTKLRVKATVKSHDEYREVKQTVVSRVAILETLSQPEIAAEA